MMTQRLTWAIKGKGNEEGRKTRGGEQLRKTGTRYGIKCRRRGCRKPTKVERYAARGL